MTTDAYFVGKAVPLRFLLTDAEGEPADASSYSLVMTRPDGSTEPLVATNDEAGDYRNDYFPQTPGRYVATFTGYGENADAIEDTFDVAGAASGLLTLAQVRSYLSESGEQWSDEELTGALAAEQFAQARACRIDPYSPDLLESLKRRVARNLAMRVIPIGIASGASFQTTGVGTKGFGNRDPEIRRLEGPYRKVPIG